MKAIIKKSICEQAHASHGLKSGVAYPVTLIKKNDLNYGKKYVRIMTPGGRVLGFNEGEYELVDDEETK